MSHAGDDGLTDAQRTLLARLRAAGGTLEVQRARSSDKGADGVPPMVIKSLQRKGFLRATRLDQGRSRMRLDLVPGKDGAP